MTFAANIWTPRARQLPCDRSNLPKSRWKKTTFRSSPPKKNNMFAGLSGGKQHDYVFDGYSSFACLPQEKKHEKPMLV